ncbi:MAG: GMP synthase [Sulfolobales archaeon]|nr:GMP synthase [Sulfolobales archaeon]MDW8082746.1 GMP synthase [Sulfolobales archaeon]
MFDPARFVEEEVEKLRKAHGRAERVLAAISGGVDSVTSAVLVRRALGGVVRAIYINTGFMRLGEERIVADSLKGLIDVDIVDRSERFYRAILGLGDAEEKRIAFRDVFYRVLAELIREYRCDYLVQGTIKADIVETVGGVKTQHNVLSEELQRSYGVKVIEPLKELYKHEVREVAKYLGIPDSIAKRQPFPGPGLLVRTVGMFTLEKLGVVQKATKVVEDLLSNAGASQYFAAVWEYEVGGLNTLCLSSGRCLEFYKFKTLGTGVRDGKRIYAPVALVKQSVDLSESEISEFTERAGVSRLVALLTERSSGKYFVSVRAIGTLDFITAKVVVPSPDILSRVGSQILEIDKVKAVGFDITPKPPATIEYE